WRFKSTTGAPDGVTGVTLKAATVPHAAKIQVKAKGNPAFPTGLPLPTTPGVVAQLKTSLGTCWGATFSAPTVDTATEFKATSDCPAIRRVAPRFVSPFTRVYDRSRRWKRS